jgi:DNA-binding HxlR family transcriptional regulator
MAEQTESPNLQHHKEDSATRALSLVGERWTMLILREAYFGVRRYAQFAQQLSIPRPTLSDRLAKLVGAGLLSRERYAGGPIRADYEYRLTQAGLDLFPVIVVLMEWGDRYLGDRSTSVWTHDTCGTPTHPMLTCDHCGQPVTGQNVHLADG